MLLSKNCLDSSAHCQTLWVSDIMIEGPQPQSTLVLQVRSVLVEVSRVF